MGHYRHPLPASRVGLAGGALSVLSLMIEVVGSSAVRASARTDNKENEMSLEYVIQEVNLPHNNGKAWTVVTYQDGVCLGGDHHWLSLKLAEAARDALIAKS